MVFNGDGTVLGEEAIRHFRRNQTPGLFLRRSSLNQNARSANQ
jgi:hypothetical protein